jgi:hypothetical protein
METDVLWLCGAPFLPAGGEIDRDKPKKTLFFSRPSTEEEPLG